MIHRHAERRAFARVDQDRAGWSFVKPGITLVVRRNGRTTTIRAVWVFWALFGIGVIVGALIT